VHPEKLCEAIAHRTRRHQDRSGGFDNQGVTQELADVHQPGLSCLALDEHEQGGTWLHHNANYIDLDVPQVALGKLLNEIELTDDARQGDAMAVARKH